MKKITGIALALIFVVGLISGCGLSSQAKPSAEQKPRHNPTTIRIGYQPSMPQAAFLVAKEKGLFEEEFSKDGIEIKYEKFIIGPPLIEAFSGNRLDFGLVGDQPAIQARANKIDLKAIGVYSSTEKGAGLVVPVDSAIFSPKDLKGKKVGVPVGSIYHQILLLYLKNNGLTVKDIQLVNMNPPDIKTAISTKDIDAAVLGEPWISTIEYEKAGKQVADTTGIKLNVSVIVTSASFAQEYPDTVKRVLQVYNRAQKWLQENPSEGEKLVVKAIGAKPEVVAKALPKSSYDIRLTDEAIASIADTARFLRENNTIRQDVDIKELIDTRYLQAIGL
jgi:sulfonate transport system substrate-binding protein